MDNIKIKEIYLNQLEKEIRSFVFYVLNVDYGNTVCLNFDSPASV